MLGPINDPRRRPLQVFLMRFRHMFCKGGVLALLETPLMGHDSPVIQEDLHGIGAKKDLDLLSSELVRNAVVVLLDVDVIVDVYRRLLEADISVPLFGKGLKARSLKSFEELSTAAVKLPELPCIEAFQKLLDFYV